MIAHIHYPMNYNLEHQAKELHTPRHIIDDLPEAAAAVSITTQPYRDYMDRAALEVSIRDPHGHLLGGTINGDHLFIDHVRVPSDPQIVAEYGTAAVQRAAQYAADNKLRLSFSCCTVGIRPALSRMRRAGYALRSNPHWSLIAAATTPAVEIGTTATSFSDDDD